MTLVRRFLLYYFCPDFQKNNLFFEGASQQANLKFRYFYVYARNNSAIYVKITDWYRATDYGVLYVTFNSQNMFCDLNYLTLRVCPSL